MAPWFAVNMPGIDFQDIYYYIKPTESQVDAWDQLPDPLDLNSRQWRGATITSASGHGNARAVARLYGALARGGELDGPGVDLDLQLVDLLLTAGDLLAGPLAALEERAEGR